MLIQLIFRGGHGPLGPLATPLEWVSKSKIFSDPFQHPHIKTKFLHVLWLSVSSFRSNDRHVFWLSVSSFKSHDRHIFWLSVSSFKSNYFWHFYPIWLIVLSIISILLILSLVEICIYRISLNSRPLSNNRPKK